MVVTQTTDDKRFVGVRLPTTCKPLLYDVTLEPNLTDYTFIGQVSIELELQPTEPEKSISEIVLHANGLDFKDASFVADETHQVKEVILGSKTETAVLVFEKPIKAASGSLNISFTGTLNDKMRGFYRSKYTAANGQERYAAVTQFEATDARRAFPCWDEPAIKARFDVTLVVDDDRTALSNMNVVEETKNSNGKRVVKFATSPIMSTYLVACVVGEFDYVEGKCGDRPVRVYTPIGKKGRGEYALEVAVKSLPYYEDYFGIEYPLPKMDLIAIPDFAAGAMENWGLVTYRETCLLVDPSQTSTDRKQYIALVVAHELAHQWFGNLVTMEWWTHLWLNEGFASFMEFLCVDQIFPEYDIWTQFVTDSYSKALELDALDNSHPIEVPVNHPSEIDEIFDDISYNKGASVIRMLHKYISDECFRSGMKSYLNKFAFKNAKTEDLWEALEKASQKPVCAVMTKWIKQQGFPYIQVESKTEGSNLTLSLTQKKFSANGSVSPKNDSITWLVPVTVSTAANPDKVAHQILLEDKVSEIKLDNVGDGWVKLNPGTVGLYRTAYPKEMMEKLRPAISSQTLPPLDRLGLQNDFFALCQAGAVSSVELLKLLQAFDGEDNYTVWNSIDGCLSRLNILLSHTDYQDKFHQFGRKLYSRIFANCGWDVKSNENHTDAMTRALVIGRLVSFGDNAVIEEAKKRYEAHINKTQPISADLRSAVYRAVASYGEDKMFDSLFTIYREADLHEEKLRAARALGGVRDQSRIAKVLDFAMSDEVRNQDKVFVIISVAMTKHGRDSAWSLLKEKKEEFISRYESGFLIARLVKYLTENFASEEKAAEVSEFFEKNNFPGAERVVQQSLETIRLNAAWLKRDSASIKDFLSESS
ncbi:Puromycin-sensitive aminopeptidase, partial [Fragariocoptes setiger]